MARPASAAALAALLALCGLARPAASDGGTCNAQDGGCARPPAGDSPVNLLQVATMTKSGAARQNATATGTAAATCSVLGNKGSWFSVKVGVGTPAQYFELVADTTSNKFIVPDCKCTVKGGGCSRKHACFHSNFNDVGEKKDEYGSGFVTTVTAFDETVEIGGIKALGTVDLIMHREASLGTVLGPYDGSNFEGIVGLGLPSDDFKSPLWSTAGPYAWAKRAGIHRFSVCLGEKGGALRFNAPPLTFPMENIGKVHWGLDMRGMSVGKAWEKVLFCRKEDMKPGQKTPCGAILDSGTTILLGPEKQIFDLYGTICKQWPRCMKQALKTKESPSVAFYTTLMQCDTWLDEGKGINELPSIFFHYAGSQGVVQTLEVSPVHYINEASRETVEFITGKLFKYPVNVPYKFDIPDGGQRICAAAFGPMEYDTAANGPMWVFGQPLFYQATVSFDNRGKGSIAIQQGACTRCDDAEPDAVLGTKPERQHLRRISELRLPPATWAHEPL